MTPPMKLTAVYEPVEDGWIQARLIELPGVITTGRTHGEAKEMLRDALAEYLASFDSTPAADASGVEREKIELKIAS